MQHEQRSETLLPARRAEQGSRFARACANFKTFAHVGQANMGREAIKSKGCLANVCRSTRLPASPQRELCGLLSRTVEWAPGTPTFDIRAVVALNAPTRLTPWARRRRWQVELPVLRFPTIATHIQRHSEGCTEACLEVSGCSILPSKVLGDLLRCSPCCIGQFGWPRCYRLDGPGAIAILVEQEIAQILEEDMSDEPEIACAVTSVSDEKKGERLIVLHTPMKKTAREIIDHLQDGGLPNLFIPSTDSFIQVDQIKLPGTGKLDLRGIKDVAAQRCSG